MLINYAFLSTNALIELTEDQLIACDVNSDGKIDASDATEILKYYSYLSTGGTLDFKAYMSQER